jgi:hypothetical protein
MAYQARNGFAALTTIYANYRMELMPGHVTGLASLPLDASLDASSAMADTYIAASVMGEGVPSQVRLHHIHPTRGFHLAHTLPPSRDVWGVCFLGAALEDGLVAPLSGGRALLLRPAGAALQPAAEWRGESSDVLEVGGAPAALGDRAVLLAQRNGRVLLWDVRAPPAPPLLHLPAPPALLAPLPCLFPHALLAADAGALAGVWDARFLSRPLFTLANYTNSPTRRCRPSLLGALLAAPAGGGAAVVVWELGGGGGAGRRLPVACTPATPTVEGCHLMEGASVREGGYWPALVVLHRGEDGAQAIAHFTVPRDEAS